MDKKYPLIYSKLQALDLSKTMGEQLESLVDHCDKLKWKLKIKALREQQEDLFQKLDKFKALDTFLDAQSSNTFKSVKKELSDDIFEAG